MSHLSTSTPVHMPSDNYQSTEAKQDELSFQQVIPNIPQQSLYPSLVAMGSPPNTASSPSIPLSRRVINDIEEYQRTVLNSYVEGMDRGTNTSPVSSSDEQQVKMKTTSTGQKPVVTQAELQENTLQPESLEIEDTGMKQADPTNVQAQDIKENDEPVEVDTNEQQAQVANKILRLIKNNKSQIYLKIRHLEHHKMIIIELPLMMMSRMTQYSLAIQLHNHSCQEVLEYSL